MSRFTKKLAEAAVALAFGSSQVFAATKSATITVTARIVGSCSITAGTNITFDNIDTAATTTSTFTSPAGTVNVTCPRGQSYTVNPQAPGIPATLVTYNMVNGANNLPFNMFVNGTTASSLTQNGTGAAQSINLFARTLTTAAALPAGNYTTNVTVELIY